MDEHGSLSHRGNRGVSVFVLKLGGGMCLPYLDQRLIVRTKSRHWLYLLCQTNPRHCQSEILNTLERGIVRANSFALPKRQNRISRPLIFLHFSGSI
jgi:hypothetical protein